MEFELKQYLKTDAFVAVYHFLWLLIKAYPYIWFSDAKHRVYGAADISLDASCLVYD